MSKKIKFHSKSISRPTADQVIAGLPRTEPLKRLTIDIEPDLHKRIKIHCASHDVKMADVLRELLEKGFPA